MVRIPTENIAGRQYHSSVLLVCLSDPPGEYQIVDDDGRAHAPRRVFTTATPAAFAQQLANTHRQPVRVVSAVDPAFDDSVTYEAQSLERLDTLAFTGDGFRLRRRALGTRDPG